MNLVPFGRQLLETGDLDPIYTILWKAELHPNQLRRWLLAYWWFYHAGVSSHLSACKGNQFYREAAHLASKTATRRGTERRHFRGQKCLDCISWFQRHYPAPESAVHSLERSWKISKLVKHLSASWPLFGPWMGFKVGDMLERLALAPVEFPAESLSMYSTPVKGAKLACKLYDWDMSTEEVVTHLISVYHRYKAPPRYERPVNAQEIETILCKWKSHKGGHYPLMKDTHEIKEGLIGYGALATGLRRFL